MAGELGHGARCGAGAEAGGEAVEEGAEALGRKVCGKEAWPVASGGRNSGPRCPHPDNTPRADSAVTVIAMRVTRMVFNRGSID